MAGNNNKSTSQWFEKETLERELYASPVTTQGEDFIIYNAYCYYMTFFHINAYMALSVYRETPTSGYVKV